jgi:hypothetical protein
MKIIFCDKCGNEINTAKFESQVTIDFTGGIYRLNICKECNRDIIRFIDPIDKSNVRFSK